MTYSSQDLSNFIPEVWSKTFIKIHNTMTVMENLTNRELEEETYKGGDTVHVRQYGDVTTNTYTKNMTLSLDQLSSTDNTMTIDQFKYQLFAVDDVDKAQADIDIREGYVKRAVISMRNTIDSRLISHYADANAANVMGTTSAPETLTKDNIYDYFTDMHTNLDNQNVEDQDRYAVVTPATRGLIRKSQELRGRGSDLVDEVVRNGYAGNFAGWKIQVTTNIATVGSSKPHLFITKDFINFTKQLDQTEAFREANVAATQVRVLCVYGSKVFTENAKNGGVIHVAA